MLNRYLYKLGYLLLSLKFHSSSFQSTGNFQMPVLSTLTNNYYVTI